MEFDFLPGADVTKAPDVKQQSWTQAVDQQKQDRVAAQERKESTSVWTGIGASSVKGGVGLVDRVIEEIGYEPEEGFRIPDDRRKHWEELGIRPQQWELFGRAVSMGHLEFLESLAFQNQMADEDLAQFSTAAQMGMSFIDPVYSGIDAVAAPLGFASKAGRIGNALRAGAVGAATVGALEGASTHYDPEKTAEDVMMSTAVSFALAGAFGARRGDKIGEALVDPEAVERTATTRLTEDDSLSAARVRDSFDGADPTPGLQPLRDESAEEVRRLDEAYHNRNIQPAFASVRRDLAARMGKAESPLVREVGRVLFRDGVGYTDKSITVRESTGEFSRRHLATLETEFRSGVNAAWSAFRERTGTGRLDFHARANFNEEVGRAVRGDTNVSAEAKQAAESVRSVNAKLLQLQKDSGLDDFAHIEQNGNYLPRYWSAKNFQKLFGEMGLDEDHVIEDLIMPSMRKAWEANLPAKAERKIDDIAANYRGSSDEVRKAHENAEVHRTIYGEKQALLKEAEEQLLALPDTASKTQITKAEARVRRLTRELQTAERRFEKSRDVHAKAAKREDESGFALKEAKKVADMDEIDEDLLRVVAKAYLKRAQRNFDGDEMALGHRSMALDDVEEIRRLLDEAGVNAAESQHVLGRLQAKAEAVGKLDRAKHRIDLDENFSTTLRNEAGEEFEVRMSDLFENDIEQVMARHTREAIGWSALSAKANIKNRVQLDRYKAQLIREARKAGDDPKDIERLFDIGIDTTFMRSTEKDPTSKGSRYGRFLRQYNFARVMNQVGFSLFAEIGPTIAHGGVRNFLDSAVHIKDFIQRGADGKLSSKEARMVEELFAPGTEWMRNPPLMRLEDDGFVPPTFGNSAMGRKLDNGVAMASHVTSIMSGMAPMNTMLQRIAGRATVLRLLDLANTPQLSKATVARLRNWGMTQKDQDALFAVLKGVKKIEDIPVDKLDFKTRESMAAFLYRVTRHQVLEGDAADSLELMHSWHGKLLTQFRTFMVNSYTRHFLNSFHHWDDVRTYVMVTASTAAAGMGWAARTYINTAGDPERRRKQLTVENFYKNSIAQSSYSSIVPMLADTAWNDLRGAAMFGKEVKPYFQNNRSTGLENGVMGIPTIDLMSRIVGARNIPAVMLDPDAHVTQKMAEDFSKAFIWQNAMGAVNVRNEALKLLPEKQLPDPNRDPSDDEGTPLFPW